MFIKVVGIDIAKNLFQVCVLSTAGQIFSNRNVKRDRLIDTAVNYQSKLLLRWSHAQLHILGLNISGARL